MIICSLFIYIFFVRWGRSCILSSYFFWWWCWCWEWWWSGCLECLGKLPSVKPLFFHVYLLLELIMLRSSSPKKEGKWKYVLLIVENFVVMVLPCNDRVLASRLDCCCHWNATNTIFFFYIKTLFHFGFVNCNFFWTWLRVLLNLLPWWL